MSEYNSYKIIYGSKWFALGSTGLKDIGFAEAGSGGCGTFQTISADVAIAPGTSPVITVSSSGTNPELRTSLPPITPTSSSCIPNVSIVGIQVVDAAGTTVSSVQDGTVDTSTFSIPDGGHLIVTTAISCVLAGTVQLITSIPSANVAVTATASYAPDGSVLVVETLTPQVGWTTEMPISFFASIMTDDGLISVGLQAPSHDAATYSGNTAPLITQVITGSIVHITDPPAPTELFTVSDADGDHLITNCSFAVVGGTLPGGCSVLNALGATNYVAGTTAASIAPNPATIQQADTSALPWTAICTSSTTCASSLNAAEFSGLYENAAIFFTPPSPGIYTIACNVQDTAGINATPPFSGTFTFAQTVVLTEIEGVNQAGTIAVTINGQTDKADVFNQGSQAEFQLVLPSTALSDPFAVCTEPAGGGTSVNQTSPLIVMASKSAMDSWSAQTRSFVCHAQNIDGTITSNSSSYLLYVNPQPILTVSPSGASTNTGGTFSASIQSPNNFASSGL